MNGNHSHLSGKDLHGALLKWLASDVCDHSDPDVKPFELDLKHPLPSRVRVYIFNATHPPGGRTTGEHKIQMMIPGQARGQRSDFDYSGGRIVLLMGYEHELGVFILWDAGLYRNFPFSRNVQVKAETVYAAYAGEIAQQDRRLWTSSEIVVAAHCTRLREGILLRHEITLKRLVAGGTPCQP